METAAGKELLQFLTKLGVEDVLPLLTAGGATSLRKLYGKSFDDWRQMGISYGDCCYLDSSKPADLGPPNDDEAPKEPPKEGTQSAPNSPKSREQQKAERKKKRREQRRLKYEQERQQKQKEEQERLQKEEQERKEKEAQEQREKEQAEEAQREREALEKQAREKEEQERKEREEQEQREKEEQELRERQELERQEKEARERDEQARAAPAETEQHEKGEPQKAKPEEQEDLRPKRTIVPSLSLGDVPVVHYDRKPKSAGGLERRGSDAGALISPRTRKEKKEEKHALKKKKKEEKKAKKEKKKGVSGEFKPPLPKKPSFVGKSATSTGGSLRGSKSSGHKKSVSTGFTGKLATTDNLDPISKEGMLKKLSSMGQRYDLFRNVSPGEARRRNTVSELRPPDLAAEVTFTEPPSARLKKIVTCQAVVRGFLERKHYHRWRVAREILATEQSYVEDLELILKSFISPLEKKAVENDTIIDKNHIYFIFYNLKDIYAEHQTILKLLRKRIFDRQEFAKNSVCDIFTENVAKPLALLYFPYVNNFSKSIKALKKCKRDVPAFSEFVEKAQARPECHLQDLESLLILPIQRVTRYSILLKSLLGKYTKGTPLYSRLAETWEVVRDKLDEINECKREAENLAFVDELMRGFSYDKGVKKVQFSARRRFIREGTVYREWKSKDVAKPVHFLLFNDLLVVTKEESDKKAPPSKSPRGRNSRLVTEVIPLVDVSKVSLSHANEKECKSFKFRAAKHRYEFFLKNNEHCRGWVEILTTSLAKANEARENTLRRKANNLNGKGVKARPPLLQAKPTPLAAPRNQNHDEEFSYG